MRIAICCGSSNDVDKKYFEDAKVLLEEIFKKDNDLVFGAYNAGIMGVAYKVAKKHNRKVIGVAPETYQNDFKNLECNNEIVTKNVNERTDEIIKNADCLLFLPGGIGTIYELMTCIERKRSNEFDKPIIIYNKDGFFDFILEMLNRIYEQKFTSLNVKSSYTVVADYMSVIDIINSKKF